MPPRPPTLAVVFPQRLHVRFIAEITTAFMPLAGWARFLLGDVYLMRTFHRDAIRVRRKLAEYNSVPAERMIFFAPEGAIAAARAAAALSIPASRGGRLAAALASPPPPREGCRVASAAEGRSAPSRSVVASVSSRAGSGSSLDAALADALAPLWCAGNPAVDARLREALDADGRADDAAVAAAKRRRRGRGGGGGSIAIASGSAMTLPLVLLAHPSANVRSAAADAFASRVAAAPDRAPAAWGYRRTPGGGKISPFRNPPPRSVLVPG